MHVLNLTSADPKLILFQLLKAIDMIYVGTSGEITDTDARKTWRGSFSYRHIKTVVESS